MRDDYIRKYLEFDKLGEIEILEALHQEKILLSRWNILWLPTRKWKKEAKEKLNQMKKGKLTEDEVYEWIKKINKFIKNWIKCGK